MHSVLVNKQNLTQHTPSMSSQCPVSTQMSTNMTEREKDKSSARVKRPQQPNEILKRYTYIEEMNTTSAGTIREKM